MSKQWIETKTGGFWSITKDKGRHKERKHSLFCPYEECRRITGTIDDKYLEEYGVCSRCYVYYIKNREEPLIDVEHYKSLR